MFQKLGNIVASSWPVVLLVWVILLAVSHFLAPPWNDVAEDKEFGFLPASSPSLVAETEFKKAFPEEQIGSSIVLVLTNPGGARQIQVGKDFIGDVLEPKLRKIAESEGGIASEANANEESNDPFAEQPATPKPTPAQRPIVERIRTPNAPGTGALLESEDGKALLVAMELNTEFLSSHNWPIIRKVEDLISRLKEHHRLPEGMDLAITGSAVLGRDHSRAQLASSRATEWLTIVMVIGLLVVIYRAPLLALIPLATVFLSVKTALNLLAILAGQGYMTLFQGIQVFITVLVYGAGVDYCLFLMARYKEELDHGRNTDGAISHSIGQVGAALAASAGTVICGIGMMSFAQFGKFQQAGLAIPFALTIVLLATLTFSAAALRLAGRWAFWPHVGPEGRPEPERPAHTSPKRSLLHRFFQPGEMYRGWEWMGRHIMRRPGAVWGTTVAIMVPFAVAGFLYAGQVAYDIISNLPNKAPSVQGVQVLREHFPEGILGPVTTLLVNEDVDFATPEGREIVAKITDRLRDRKNELELADVRSLTEPLGVHVASANAFQDIQVSDETRQRAIREQALDRYTTDLGGRKHVGTRLDLVLDRNPFGRDAVDDLDRLEGTIKDALPANLRDGTKLYFLGPTSSIRDLGRVHDSDHTRISILVLSAVFVILVILLRAPFVSLYLVLSVLFSYYATIGVTYLFFWALDPHHFAGLDWKVSTFLFTILIAVGEDYNIFLMARVHEEQRRHGPFRGILCAMTRTGPIISSCGIIMAGTFASLLAGSLSEMIQLGFALAFGVLVDTFVVRPILVPAFLVMREKWRHRRERPERQAAVAAHQGSC